MKYNNTNKPIECIMKNNACYKETGRATPVGVLWHSTGANNPLISRYVQPHETDPNYSKMIALLGKNKYGNDWNHSGRRAGVHAFIGKLADGTVAAVQTLPWNYAPWGCGRGKNGSCNGTYGGRHWLQFEICEDALTDRNYFNQIYKEACEFTAYLCKIHNFDPYGTVDYNGVEVPVILCHADSYKLGLGSNHGDIYHWFKKYGKTMDDVRKDVASLMKMPSAPVGDNKTDNTTDKKIDTVIEVQKWLNVSYASNLVPDNIYGSKTKKALVKALQKELGFVGKDVDGIFGSKTRAVIPTLRRGSKGNVVKVLQALLVCNGYTAAYADGNFGQGTEQSVKDYQWRVGIEIDGLAGKDTFENLCT